ncbi:MAG: magnesium transporter [Gammaproteobacteria bacterium]|nr:MAG: magnesium transporter [Gammaproteobacteria bacterium]
MPSAEQEKETLLGRVNDALEGKDNELLEMLLDDMHPADIADLLESLPPEKREAILNRVDPDLLGEVLIELSEGVREDLIDKIDDLQLVAATKTLETDELADLIAGLPQDRVAEVLFALDRQTRERLDTVMGYPEDSAGGLMDMDAVTVRQNVNIDVVQRYLRLRGELPEYTDKLFVVNSKGELRGALRLTDILTTQGDTRVKDIMDPDPVIFHATDSANAVAAAFERYNLISAPVVDEDGQLIGRITIDDIVDVIREEADHDVMARAGLDEEADIFAPVRKTTRDRAVWLGINLITAFIASAVIAQFQGAIEKIVALAVLMPVVASMGGNAGIQTLTIAVRGLATGTISPANAMRVIRHELLVGGLNGLIWALVIAAITVLWFHDVKLGLVIAAATFINLIAAALAGVLLPLGLKKAGIDPALAGGVTLTTVADVVGYLAFLGLAAAFLL